MEGRLAETTAKPRGNVRIRTAFASLRRSLAQHLPALALHHDGCAGERPTVQQELPNAANTLCMSNLLRPLLLFTGRAWSSTSLEQRAHASTTPAIPFTCTTTYAGRGDGISGVRRGRLPSRTLARRPALCVMAMAVAACLIFLRLTVLLVRTPPPPPPPSKPRRVVNITALQPIQELTGRARGTSVLVQHEGAVQRLNLTAAQGACVTGAGALGGCAPIPLSANELPAWTLHVVAKDCADCMYTYTYDSAVEGVALQPRHAVFATSSAPLGRVGPMLLAMASVTDDVNVRTELPRWEWLRHVYGEGFPTVGDAGERAARPRTPYLAVMGIPSTDQPERAALREAQRKTWLTYQEVARADNHFDAALLALYIFAAVEPKPVTDAPVASSAPAQSSTPAAGLAGERLSALLPTTAEYKAATDALLRRTTQAESTSGLADEGFVQHRMGLRRDWSITAVEDTPCAEVVRRRVTVDEDTSVLSYLSGALSLPVTPAFTSPAGYICHASSALWQEVLTHRNAVWIDMMTDRRPTTNKRLGEDGKWGLPVEVGMSQKLILWLAYAYHAFPDVPFIIKGDDDSYLKVPQFLSDVRYVRNGVKRGRLPPPPPRNPVLVDTGDSSTTQAATRMRRVSTYKPTSVEKTKCFYWGSGRRMLGVRFHAGMLFMLHRRLVQTILEPPQERADVDLGMLAARDFSEERALLYREAGLQHEDVMVGVVLRHRYNRSRQLCADETIWYVKEGRHRFHDVHHGKLLNVTWSTVVAHRCRPADMYYLHYFFQKEYRASAVELMPGDDPEEVAIESAAAWVAEQRGARSASALGWDDLPSVRWTQQASAAPAYDVAAADNVAVYHCSYQYWKESSTFVWDGYQSSA